MSNFISKMTILYVEDRKDINKNLMIYLEDTIDNAIYAKTGEEAVLIYKDYFTKGKKIDLIISSINLPKMSGTDMYESIKLIHQEAICIFISTRTDKETLLKAVELNVEAYFLKPVVLDDLKEKILYISDREYMKKQIELQRGNRKNYINALNNIAIVYTMKRSGVIESINDMFKEISGYEHSDVNNLNLTDFIHPSVSKDSMESVWKALDEGKLWTGDTKFRTKNNEVFYLKISIFKVNEYNKEEYITIGFLTTQENLKKREFHKNVLNKMKDFNTIIYDNKKELAKLTEENNDYKVKVSSLELNINELKKKNINKERQLNHYEKQMENVDGKGIDFLKQKSQELKDSIEKNKELKGLIDTRDDLIRKMKDELELKTEKLKESEEKNIKRSKEIKDLHEVIDDMEEKMEELK